MKNIKLILSALSVVFIASTSFGIQGGGATGVGGGGDSDAVDALITIKSLNQWLQKSNIGLSTQNKEALSTVTKRISKEMEDPHKTPIRMVGGVLRDASGTEKMALFSKDPFSIQIQRRQWKSLGQIDKFVLIGLELFGLADVPDRYSLAENIKKDSGILSTIRGDLQLFNFMIGSWHLAEGACLSGRPVHWGIDPKELPNYELRVKFDVNSTSEQELLYKGVIKVRSKSHFSVQKANLSFTDLERCTYESGREICESGLADDSLALLTIQGNQHWLLYNQGPLGGSCEPQDVFVMKFQRQ